MTIVLTGGGSGGHITPILAVAGELKKLEPKVNTIYIGQIGDRFGNSVKGNHSIDDVFSIRAGKFRRFHGEGIKQVLNVVLVLRNLRDLVYVAIGIYQSWKLIKRLKPDVVFSRGGYVSVPVALGAKLNKVPYITHDSDSIPSLANKLIARWACVHAVALPKNTYPYPANKTITTGIPVNDKFKPVSSKDKATFRRELKIEDKAKIVFVIGGGQGSLNINKAMTEAAPHLLSQFSNLQIIHVVGEKNIEAVEEAYKQVLQADQSSRVKLHGFINDVYLYSGAADIIVSRAGATNIAEFAIQAKPIILIPSSFLAGGHQLKNAQYLNESDAAIVVREEDMIDDSNRLTKQISDLLLDETRQGELAKNLSSFAKPNATNDIAKLILKVGSHETTESKN